MNWEKFDEIVDDEFRKQIKDADTSSGEYKEVPIGDYEVKIEKMELKASRKGDPMVSIWFRILAGEFKNSLIFMNQVINIPFQVSIANKILGELTPDLEVKFETYSQYGNMIMDIFEEIDNKYEYAIRYGENKGFPTFEILDVFEL